MQNAQSMPNQPNVVWSPQVGPQTAFIHCPVEEIMYGGARGGGKTDAALGLCIIKGEKYGKHHHAIFFRRELTQLDAVISRAKEICIPLGWEYKEGAKTMVAPNGATIKFRHLERDSDAEKYQGWSVQTIVFEEATNFPDPKPIMKLKGILRSVHGVPCQMILTSNPGGPGMSWVKKRYIDPAPLGWKIIKHTDKISGLTTERVFIPAKVADNKLLTSNDPMYVARLAQTGSEQLVKAWLNGDWNIVDGAFFSEFEMTKHVIKTGPIPPHWTVFRCGDWGSARPFAFYWMAVASEPWHTPCGKLVPKGAIIVFREYYGIKIDADTGEYVPNVGLRLFAEEVGRNIAAREKDIQRPSYGVIDPSACGTDGGPSLAERMYKGSNGKAAFRAADNKRTPGRGAMGGWDQVRSRLVGEDVGDGKGPRPMVYFMDCCEHLIRTLPMQQHDADNLEDIDTEAEDHAVDALRYGLMSRPYGAKKDARRDFNADTALGYEALNMEDLWTERDSQREQQGYFGRI